MSTPATVGHVEWGCGRCGRRTAVEVVLTEADLMSAMVADADTAAGAVQVRVDQVKLKALVHGRVRAQVAADHRSLSPDCESTLT